MTLALSNMDSQQIVLAIDYKDYYLISLRQFITCGKLGKISFCMTENQVKRVIGDPDSVLDIPCDHGSLFWQYGNLELCFVPGGREKRGLFYIMSNFPTSESMDTRHNGMFYDPWIIKAGLTAEKFLNKCRSRQISVEEQPRHNEKCREFVAGAGISFIFRQEGDTAASYRLRRMVYADI